jgi:hypothetical protein
MQPEAGSCTDESPADLLCGVAFLAAPLLHAGALFSNSFILAEGRALGFGLASLTALLTRSAMLTASQQGSTHGSDSAIGTDAAPLNGLKAASDAVRETDEQQHDGPCPLALTNEAAVGEAGKCGEPALSVGGGILSSSQTGSVLTAAGASSSLSQGDGCQTGCQPPTAPQAEDVQSNPNIPAAARQPPPAAPAVDVHSGVSALATGAAALMLLWALGQRGLVVRSGHDAMWRTAAEHRAVLPADGTVPRTHPPL